MNSVQPAAQPSPWNVPNALTVLRVVAVPFFVYFLLADGGQLGADRIIAAVIFLAAIITDQIDGAWARKYNLITDFGKIADPIADKLLIGAALICLSILGELWWWVTALILLREIGITVWRITIVKNKVVPASRGGKIKTVLQTVALLLYLSRSLFGGVRWGIGRQ